MNWPKRAICPTGFSVAHVEIQSWIVANLAQTCIVYIARMHLRHGWKMQSLIYLWFVRQSIIWASSETRQRLSWGRTLATAFSQQMTFFSKQTESVQWIFGEVQVKVKFKTQIFHNCIISLAEIYLVADKHWCQQWVENKSQQTTWIKCNWQENCTSWTASCSRRY